MYFVGVALAYVTNFSFNKRIFSNDLKIALVKPINRKGGHNNLSNYRPINSLPTFSKFYESIVDGTAYKACYRYTVQKPKIWSSELKHNTIFIDFMSKADKQF